MYRRARAAQPASLKPANPIPKSGQRDRKERNRREREEQEKEAGKQTNELLILFPPAPLSFEIRTPRNAECNA